VALRPAARYRVAATFVWLAIGTRALATESGPSGRDSGSELPGLPDCKRHAACLCPWRDVLDLTGFRRLPDSLVPRQVVECPGQDECEWRLVERGSGPAIFHSRPDYRSDPLPIEPKPGSDPPPWAAGDDRRCVLAVDDGWIVAMNAGEFGANLMWVSRDATRYETLGHPSVVGLIKNGDGVWAPTGLDHIVDGKGAVLLLARTRAGQWRVTRKIAIGSSAYAATTDPDGSLIVVTRTELVKVALNGRVTKLHEGRWDGFFEVGPNAESAFYPGSVIVRSNGDVFIGMRAAIVHLIRQRNGYREEWLAPAKCHSPR
jgi:hypothetical protein